MTQFQYGRSLQLFTGAAALALTVVLSACGGGGGGDSSGSVTPDSTPVAFAFVADADTDDVSAYTIDAGTGALTQVLCGGGAGCSNLNPDNFPAGDFPFSVTVDPSGKFVYVANDFSDDVSAYTIDVGTGALTPIDADPLTVGVQNFPAGTSPHSVTVDPLGKFVYVANREPGNSDISAYTIDAITGALTPIDADPLTAGVQNFPAGIVPVSITVDPSGKFVYVANASSDVSAYTLDAASGALTPIDADPLTAGVQNFPAGDFPVSVTVDPLGKYVYVANFLSAGVSAYAIDAGTGALTPIDADLLTAGVQNFPAGTDPFSVTVDPSGKFVYVANANSADVSAYTLDADTGVLTPIDADPLAGGVQNFPAGDLPASVTVDSSGKFAYVTNGGSASISAYTLDAGTGALTPIDADPLAGGVQNFPAGTGPASIITTR